MIFLTSVLVLIGLFFPVVSALTGLQHWKRGAGWSERPSPIFVPFFGPMSLTLAIYWNDWPWWLIPIAWMTDLGTLVLLWYLPAIIREEWKTSRFTCVLRLKGSVENAHAVLTFHASGKYLLQKRWERPLREGDAIVMGELGTFTQTSDGYSLASDYGIERILVRSGESYRVEDESELPERGAYQALRDWSLSP